MSSPPPFPPGSRIFAYLRDSGHEDQELSVSQQETEIRLWSLQQGLILTKIFKDEARRGTSAVGREDLHAMMHAFRRGCEETGVVVWKYNRFARNIDNATYYRAEIRSRGYIFASMNDNIPNGPEGRVFEALIDYKDEQYVIDLSIDVKRGLRDLVRDHGCVPGIPPRGFKREKFVIGLRRDGEPHVAHKWVIDPETAPLVRQAFEMRAAGASLGEIMRATHLYNSINSFRTFWPNRLYIGILHFADLVIENYCEPIVPRTLWDAVQVIQKNYAGHHHVATGSTNHPRRANSRFLLSGLARCARCATDDQPGAPLFGRSTPQASGAINDVYLCTRAWRQRTCTRHRIPRAVIENAVIKDLQDYILTRPNLDAAWMFLQDHQSTRQSAQDEKMRRLVHQLGKVRRQITNINAAIAETGHSRSLLQTLNDLEAQELDLLTRQAQLQANAVMPVPKIDQDQLARLIANFDDHMATEADLATKRIILGALVDHVDVERDGNKIIGIIYYYYPPPDLPPKASALADDTDQENVSISRHPSGPPRYRHILSHRFQVEIKKSRR